MALGSNSDPREPDLWLSFEDLPKSPGHPFYEALQKILAKGGFDSFCERVCAPFYSDKGASVDPARDLLSHAHDRLLRGNRQRARDRVALLGLPLSPLLPPSRGTRQGPEPLFSESHPSAPDIETHQEIFLWVLELLEKHKLLKGKNLGIDASTMEANAAMRSIVRKDSRETYPEFLEGLARESGISTPTRDELKNLDRNRKKKTSNDDWENPNDPDAKISKLKDGRTKLAYKPEHTVDLDTQAVIAAEIHPANQGDTTTGPETLAKGCENLITLGADPCEQRTCVADKGYFKSEHLGDLHGSSMRLYLAEPKSKRRRKWRDRNAERRRAKREDQRAVYANRRRLKSTRGRELSKWRAERVERSFAHTLDTGGMRRTHLRGRENVQKRYLVQVAAHNLSLVMRKIFGAGKPRERTKRAASALHRLLRVRRRQSGEMAARGARQLGDLSRALGVGSRAESAGAMALAG